MHTDRMKVTRRTPPVVYLSLVLCVLLGITLLGMSSRKIGLCWPLVGPMVPDVLRDIGIAFLVSAVVAGLFELYRSKRHEMESMKDVFDFAMGDRLTGEVWQEVQELLETKEVIRRNTRLRLQFESLTGLNSHELALRVEHEYDTYSLRPKRLKFTVVHELDYQFQNQQMHLPRWEAVVIDPKDARSNQTAINMHNPNLAIEVKLPNRRDEEPVFVRTERLELAHVPGSYNFYTPEFMKGLRLSIVGCPPDIRVEVWVRPHGGGKALVDQNHTWSYEQLIFPGQGIEIKFIRTTHGGIVSAVKGEVTPTRSQDAEPAGVTET